MGLDQMAYSRDKVDVHMTWRKHPNLQGWMERLWESHGNEGSFNCIELRLGEEDIKHLKNDIENGTLNGGEDDTEGFFFGDNSDEYYKDQDLRFCDWALAEIEAGREVYYDSWW